MGSESMVDLSEDLKSSTLLGRFNKINKKMDCIILTFEMMKDVADIELVLASIANERSEANEIKIKNLMKVNSSYESNIEALEADLNEQEYAGHSDF